MECDRGPRLEMLWESCDPQQTLAQRFGFADADAVEGWLRVTLATYWDVTVESCERIVISDHNALAWLTTASGSLIAKWSAAPELFPRLSRVARLTQWLDGQGLPVSAPLPSLDGAVQVEVDGASMALQHVIDGDMLDVGDPQQVRAAGVALGELHQALGRSPAAEEPVSQRETFVPMMSRIARWLESEQPHVPKPAQQALRRLVGSAPVLDDVPQLLHGDFRSANVLCSGSSVVGVLDFEEVRFDHCVDELARSAVLLGTRFHDWGPVSPEVHAQFLAGYETVRYLSPSEQHWWDVLVLWYTLAFVPVGHDPTGWAESARNLTVGR
ncbi:phosphotransferase [Ruania alkalisoli]|uniref:Phosphotransferase n=1 Tax=Ruania alkalisoli TaxID=2779775 RepID=A0A7M1SY29_9MICO|nr:phosphotransferase [Ruania alkalisoli]QOR72445.1 phosphotransferase [Ruania alkalisoli]